MTSILIGKRAANCKLSRPREIGKLRRSIKTVWFLSLTVAWISVLMCPGGPNFLYGEVTHGRGICVYPRNGHLRGQTNLSWGRGKGSVSVCPSIHPLPRRMNAPIQRTRGFRIWQATAGEAFFIHVLSYDKIPSESEAMPLSWHRSQEHVEE